MQVYQNTFEEELARINKMIESLISMDIHLRPSRWVLKANQEERIKKIILQAANDLGYKLQQTQEADKMMKELLKSSTERYGSRKYSPLFFAFSRKQVIFRKPNNIEVITDRQEAKPLLHRFTYQAYTITIDHTKSQYCLRQNIQKRVHSPMKFL